MTLVYCRTGACDKAHNALVRLEDVFATENEFLKDDEYYLFDCRKWANLCKEPTLQLLEVPERLVKPDLKVKTQPHHYSTFSTLYGVQVAALLEPSMMRKFDGLKNVSV